MPRLPKISRSGGRRMSIEDYYQVGGLSTLKLEPFKTYISVGDKQYPLSITQMRLILESVFNEGTQDWTIRELREAIEGIE